MSHTVLNSGPPSMAENYQIARLMIAMREAGIEVSKYENNAANAGITPYLALVRALDLGNESETIISLKRLVWAMAKASGGEVRIPLGVMEDFTPDVRVTQKPNPFDKSVTIAAIEAPAAVSA